MSISHPPQLSKEQKNAAIYVRVSTREQAEKGYSLEEQVNKCRRHCEDKGWKIKRIYKEKGVSGKNLRRPKIKQLLHYAKWQKFDVVVFWRLDRLTRSLQDGLKLIELFNSIDIQISCVSEPFDTTTAHGIFMFQIKGALAEHERRLTLERSKIGIRARVRKGKWKGGRTPYGYTYDEETEKLRVNKKETKNVRVIFNKYLEIGTINGVTHYLNAHGFSPRKAKKWSNTAVGNVLGRKLYIGIYSCAGERVNLPELQIIEDEIFEEVQKKRIKRKIYGPTPKVKRKKRINQVFNQFFPPEPCSEDSRFELEELA